MEGMHQAAHLPHADTPSGHRCTDPCRHRACGKEWAVAVLVCVVLLISLPPAHSGCWKPAKVLEHRCDEAKDNPQPVPLGTIGVQHLLNTQVRPHTVRPRPSHVAPTHFTSPVFSRVQAGFAVCCGTAVVPSIKTFLITRSAKGRSCALYCHYSFKLARSLSLCVCVSV